MSTFCEQELMLRNFWFHHERPIIFVTSQFGPHLLYPAWLTVQLLYHSIVLVIDGLQTGTHDGEPTGKFFLYLTNWAYLLLVLSNTIELSTTLYVHGLAKNLLQERERKFYKMRGYLKLSWIFFTMSTVVGITVTVLNGTLRSIGAGFDVHYNLLGSRIGENTLDFGTLAFNYFNTIVILMHIIISAKPLRLLHFYLPVAFFAFYMVFSIIYQKVSDNYIYKILDWDEAFRTAGVTYGIVFVLVPLVQMLVYGLVQVRIQIGTWCRIRYSFSKWKKTKIKPKEPEVHSETNVMRWLASNRFERSKGIGIASVTPSSRTVISSVSDTVTVKSETSL